LFMSKLNLVCKFLTYPKYLQDPTYNAPNSVVTC
jgi:hypothetical protein